MSQDLDNHSHDEPSLAWYGRPPQTETLSEEQPAATGDPVSSSQSDVYGRVAMSVLIVGGALLLARSATFRAVTWRLAKFAVTTWLPARLAVEVRKAWNDAALAQASGSESASSG